MMKQYYCVNCKWFMAHPSEQPSLSRCYVTGHTDLVTGERNYDYCSIQRAPYAKEDACGIEGRNYEENQGEQPQGYEHQEEA